ILERRTRLELAPKRPPAGVPSVIRGDDPEHEYVDHEDPDAVYFVDEEWAAEAEWEPSPELVAAVTRQRESAPVVAAPADESVVSEATAEPEPETVTPTVAPVEAALVERLEAAIARVEALGSSHPVVDALERLVSLHERGWLSKAELEEAKRRVLREPNGEPGELRRVGPGRHRKTLAIDFDGVLHAYTSGWQGALEIPDPPVEGAIAWLEAAAERFDLAIFSVRAAHPGA